MTDYSETAIVGVLSQVQEWGLPASKVEVAVQRPLRSLPRKLSAVEMGCPVDDPKFLAMNDNQKHWSCNVHCSSTLPTILTEHSALQREPK